MDTHSVDLRTLVGVPLKHEASTNGGEYSGPCPFCSNGDDRFRVWPYPHSGNPRFWCRQCRKSGDAIDFVMLLDGISFREALDHLGLSDEPRHTSLVPRQQQIPRKSQEVSNWPALTDPGWQEGAKDFCDWASQLLWSDKGQSARQYLHQRGLTDPVIQNAGLGYNPHSHKRQWGSKEVWLYDGIVIPWKIYDHYWKVNIRCRPSALRAHDPRYKQAAGGANALYGADAISLDHTVLMVEGELDALCLHAQVSQLLQERCIVPVATGSVQAAHLARWVATIAKGDQVLIAFDNDEAGDQGCTWWMTTFGDKAIRLRPTHHDVTDMWKAGEDLEAWLKGIPVCS